MNFDKIETMMKDGSFKEALLILSDIPSENQTWKAKCLMLRCTNNLDDFSEDRVQFGMNLLEEVKNSKDNLVTIDVLTEILTTLYRRGEYNRAKPLMEEGLRLCAQFDNELKDKEIISVGDFYSNAAIVLTSLGRSDEALELYQKRLQIMSNLTDQSHIALTYGNIGYVYSKMGRLKDSLQSQIKALQITKKIGDKRSQAIWLHNIGSTYTTLGELDLAENSLTRSLEISQEVEMIKLQSHSYLNLGRLYRKRGDYQLAKDYFNKNLEINKSIPDVTSQIATLFELIKTSIELNERDEAQDCLYQMENLIDEDSTIDSKNQYNLAKAIVLKSSSLFRHKLRAEEILKFYLSEFEHSNSGLKIFAFLQYADLLLDQLAIDHRDSNEEFEEEEKKILRELQKIVKEIREYAITEESIGLMIQVLIIESYLELASFNTDRALELLRLAADYSSTSGVESIMIKQPEVEDQISISSLHESLPREFHVSVNKIIHSIPRLKIVLVLNYHPKLTFSELQEITGLTPGNLGRQCDKLAEVGYIHKSKEVIDDKFLTTYELTADGLREFRKYSSILKPYLEGQT